MKISNESQNSKLKRQKHNSKVKSFKMIKATIILCVKSGEKYLPELLEKIQKQKKDFGVEVVVCETALESKGVGAVEGGEEIINNFKSILNLKFLKIKNNEFEHGRTRNLLVKKARGEIIVFISQDIKITSDNWLSKLIKPFSDKKTAGVFCRQIPYDDANPYDKFFYSQTYPKINRTIETKTPKLGVCKIFFSMVCGAVRKKLLLKYPFKTNRGYAIDQWFAKEVLENGFRIQYTKETSIYHSHNYSLKEVFRRNYLLGKSLKGFPKEGVWQSFGDWAGYLMREMRYMGKVGGLKGVLGVLPYEILRIFGFMCGTWF